MKDRDDLGGDEADDLGDQGVAGVSGAGAGDALLERALALEHLGEGGAEAVHVGALGPAALEADEVEAGEVGALADHRAVGDDVRDDAREAADHRSAAEADELVDRGEAAEDDVVPDDDMTAEGGVVGHDDVVADDAVVRDVDGHHEEVVVADPGNAAAVAGAGVHGDVLADAVARADDELHRLRRANFRSWGMWPIEAKGNTWFSSPIRVVPATTTWLCSTVPAPIETAGPTTQ